MNDPTVSTIAPVCGDQDGSETPLVYNCSQFSQAVDRRYYQVPGSGSLQLHFDYVYRDALCNNELAVFRVDNTSGSINGVLPGDPSWPTQVASRNPQVVFAFGSTAATPDVDLTFQGGDILALRFHACGGYSFYSFEQANADGYDHMLAFQHSAGQPWQFAWEDGGVGGFGGGDQDFNDMMVNISAPLGASVPPQTFGPHVCRTGSGVHGRSGTRCLSDPVNSLTGAFTDAATDLSLPGTGVSFEFARSYTSADTTAGRLGPGWTDAYSASLAIQGNGDVNLHGEDGQQIYYRKQADGSFVGAAGASSVLSAVAGGYDLVRHDQVTYHFDGSGLLQSMRDRNGQGLTFSYTSGKLTGITDAAGRTATVAYQGNLISSVTTADGRTATYGYTNGLLTSVTLPDPDGAGPLAAPVTTYGYDAGGRLASEVDPNGHTVFSNVYDQTSGRVTQQTDANGKTSFFAWDPVTQRATVTDANVHTWQDVYNNGTLVKRIDPAGEVMQFGFDGDLDVNAVTSPNLTDTTSMSYENGNLRTITAPASLGSVQKSFTYDSQNNVRLVTDARQKLTAYGYDSAGNNTSVTLDGQQIAGATYNAQGQLLTSTDGNNKPTSYTYDLNGNLASVTAPDPDGAGPLEAPKTTYTYNETGLVHAMVSPLGNCAGCNTANYTTVYTYDNDGHLLTETDPLGHTTTHTYDPAGNQTSVTDANGHTTSYEYDNANDLIRETGPDPDGNGPQQAPVTTYGYDDVGNRITMIDPRGTCSGCDSAAYTTTYAYNQNNQLMSVTTPKGEKTTYTYDANGNLATAVEPRGNAQGADPTQYTTTYSYDAAGRLLTTNDPLGHVTTNHYDPVGNLEWTKDANQHQTSYSYDAAGRILTVTAPDPDGTGPFTAPVTTYTYDGNGNLKTRTDANTHTTTYSYDDAERLTQITGPDPDSSGPGIAPITTYGYDANGNLATKTDPNGNATQTAGDGTTIYAYDRADRLTGIDYSDTTPDVTFGYDNAGNRTSMSDGAGTVSYGYDNLDRLTSSTRGSDSFSYVYDPAGNITSRTYPDNTQISYGYDEDNRLATAASSGDTTSYGFDPAGNLTQTTLPAANGYIETRTYDRAGRLSEVKNANATSTLSDYAATLDPVGNPTQILQTGVSLGTTTYGYDNLDRLTSVCFQAGGCPGAGDPFIRWAYDAVGNRTSEERPGTATTTYLYNNVDELTQTTIPSGAVSYPAQVQADGAQPYWRFGETSGNTFASTVGSYTGTWTNSPTLGVTGALTGDANTAVKLNGTSQYGTVADSNQLDKTSSFSLELWVKRTTDKKTQAIVGKPLTTTTANENYALWFDGGNKLRFEVGSGAPLNKNAKLTSAAALDTNWHYIVATFASGAMKLYIDGSLSSSMTASGFTNAGANASTLDIGRAGTSNYYGGSIDELAIYGIALTATQISDHRGKGTSPPPPSTITTHTYGYDVNGNQTARDDDILTYDLANRLTSIGLPTGCQEVCLAPTVPPPPCFSDTTTYGYDGDGNRLHEQQNAGCSGPATNYLWDTNGDLPQLALERDGSGNLRRRYTYGARRISMSSGGSDFYYHYDTLGSVTNLTSSGGATEWTYSYEPFGSSRTTTHNDVNAPSNPMQFTGEYADATALYNLRAREYDPAVGRFLELDAEPRPEGEPAVGPYVYVEDRPTSLLDPSGNRSVPSTEAQDAAGLASSPDRVVPPDGGGLVCRTGSLAQREKCAFDFFVGRHLTKAQAAACVGNLWYESGQDLNPAQWEIGCQDHSWNNSRCGVGIAQWTPVARKQRLLRFAGGSKAAALDFEVQLAFVWHELKTGVGPANPNALRDLQSVERANPAAVKRATEIFMNEYEAPDNRHGRANLPARQREALRVFRRFG